MGDDFYRLICFFFKVTKFNLTNSMKGYSALTQMSDVCYAGAGPQAQMMKMGGPWQQARNFAVITGVNAGLNSFLKRVRKVDDVQNTMIAGFGAGACFSFVSGIGAPQPVPGAPPANPVMAAFSAGMGFALFNGLFFKLGEAFGGGSSKANDAEYARVKAMLTHLGLQKYEKNCKKAMLTDDTLMLWDTSSLQEAKVPAGPRLLILHHIDKYRGNAAGRSRSAVSDILSPAVPIKK